MTDPIMDFLDDANLFGGGLEGLTDDSFSQTGSVSLVDELNLSADFEPLQVESLHHVSETQKPEKLNFEPLQTFDSLKLHPVNQPFNLVGGSTESNVLSPHSQFHCSPDHQPNQANGLFPSGHNDNTGQTFVDGSPMWGHQSPISNQNGSPFHTLQGHSQSMQQMTPFLTRHDFAPHQSSSQQQPPAPVQSQPNMNHFATGQKSLNQGNQFMGVHGSTSSCMTHIGQPTAAVSTSIQQHPVTVQQFNQPTTATALPVNSVRSVRFTGSASHPGLHQSVNFSGPSQDMTPCSINSSNQFTSQYSFPNNNLANGNNLTSTTMLSTHRISQTMPCFPASDLFTVAAGTNQEAVQHMLNPNSPAKQSVLQPMHSVSTQGNFSPSSVSSVQTGVPITTSPASQVKLPNAPTQRKPTTSFLSLQGNAHQQSQARSGLNPEHVFQKRSNRQVKRKKYNEDTGMKISDDEERKAARGKTKTGSNKPAEHSVQLFVVRGLCFLVECSKDIHVSEQFVSLAHSYLHCEWATETQLSKDKRIHQKVKRFKIKQAQRGHFFVMDEEPFNPDYVEIDRILEYSCCEDKDTCEPVVYYLVKWCSLPYEDSTWELKEDVDQSKIEEFERLQQAKPCLKRVDRPSPPAWKKIEQSRDYKIGNQLREYQLEGLNWLLFNWYNRQNCILADEMGLGKTIQSITFLCEIFMTGIHCPFLIIAPLSTIANWEREFRTWTDLNVIVYHGSMISRQMIQQYEMYFRDSEGRILRGTYKFHAMITTFEMILGGCPELNVIEWRCVIIDEAHRLKNKNCKLLEGLKIMNLEHKVLLTGTPLQNTVEELFSLLHFLEPLRFSSEATFMQEFGDLKSEEQVQKLQAILKPMMLRRLKEDVEKKLAPKEETIIEVELTNIQKKYYRAILEKNFAFLSKGAGQANVPNLVNTMMELRKCCNHPYLIKGAEEKILGEFRELRRPTAPDFHLQAMIQSAGKLVLINKLLPKMKAGGHKVLIFSQMVRCLDILEDYLIQKRYPYERIDGRVRGNLRQAAIDRFSKPDSDRFVFLLCTRAGGLGINLTAADTCIIFDSDWNPQNDLQAQARCHRIGQNKAVKVYRLITRNSYEREMFDKASLKLGLDKAVLQSMNGRENSVGGIQQMSKKEIEDLLRRGAYGAIMDEEDEGSKFCEEDIDQILMRRTKTITIESEGRGSTFAKASFVASGNRSDIALDDPNFWQKWAKKAEIDLEAIHGRNSLVIDTPRVRKQTRPYNAAKDESAELSEAESDGEDKPKLRRLCDRAHGYGRTECFRIEKNLLIYGWERWKDILSHGRFKRRLVEQDVETICRALLVYCLVHYRGDEKIKSFIWDLITPTENGQTKELQNHLGLSAPVPRGRKGKKVKTQGSTFDMQAEWLRKYNPEHLLQDDGYKKHLKHHCNKVLLRVRMLYYLKQEVIGDQLEKVLDGVDAGEIDIWVPEPEQSEIPADWWDADADKSLLIGVFKHGYEKYNTMRNDPALCFLERVGKPDEKAIAAEQRGNDTFADGAEGDGEDPEYKPAQPLFKDEMEVYDPLGNGDLLYWPLPSALTTRLRRLVTAYQRSTKQELVKQEAQTKGDKRRRLCEDTVKAKEAAKIEKQQRWTRREEADFYRVVSTFGVVYDPDKQTFDWTKFRAIARLNKKTDESLQKYLYAFTAMCRRVCRLPPKEKEELFDPPIFIQPITEERASRTLYRIELLRKVREQVLRHTQLDERIKLCQPSPDLPEWWENGKHDKELLTGAAKHGISKTDYHIFCDPELSFMLAQRNFSQSRVTQSRSSTPLLHHQYQSLPSPLQVQLKQQEKKSHCEPETINCVFLKGKAPQHLKTFDEDSVASLSITHDETQDSFLPDGGKPDIQFLQERHRFAASCWPKDRVIINRIDSICHLVLKGHWIPSRRSYDYNAVTSSYTTKLLDSPSATGDFSDTAIVTSGSHSIKEDNSLLSQFTKEGGLKLTFQKQRLTQKRALETEEGTSDQQHYMAQLHDLYSTSDNSQEMAVDLSKSLLVASSSAPLSSSVLFNANLSGNTPGPIPHPKSAGTSHQISRHCTNGAFMDGQPIIKKKRGRKKNVEGIDILFMNRNKSEVRKKIKEILQFPCFTKTDRSEILGERPKQKRHRCRNPNKIDVKSLTGEERVPVINRRNAKKVGGSLAPAIKDLGRWLQENLDFGIAPEWADVVKQSGYLPESMFDRILTGPVVREEVSRRGRRPKSELTKAAAVAAAAMTVNPLVTNGLLAGMDLTSLQSLQQNLQNLQSLQLTAGLMGFPGALQSTGGLQSTAGDNKTLASMFPMMLSNMTGLPNLFGMGGLLNKPSDTGHGDKKGSGNTDFKPTDGTNERTEKQNVDSCCEISVSSCSSTSSPKKITPATSASASAASSNPLAINPLLLSSMLYPSILLPPGLNLSVPGFSQTNRFDVQTDKSTAGTTSKPAEETAEQQERTEQNTSQENSGDDGSEKEASLSTSDDTTHPDDSDSSEED
uniref:Chromodomain helicase DNA binding protein 9 n=1 Tax=Callorhinchus milii TaxID=7868 RepID=A0A4W3KAU6_CALMI